MANVSSLKPFKKGDERINRKGRPPAFDAIHELAKELCCEEAEIENGSVRMSQLEAILRDWLRSKSFQKQLAVIQYAYGKVPEKIEINDEKSTIIVRWSERMPVGEDSQTEDG